MPRTTHHRGNRDAFGLEMAKVAHDAAILFGSRACGDQAVLVGAIGSYETRRNSAKSIIHRRFSTQDARRKVHRLYP